MQPFRDDCLKAPCAQWLCRPFFFFEPLVSAGALSRLEQNSEKLPLPFLCPLAFSFGNVQFIVFFREAAPHSWVVKHAAFHVGLVVQMSWSVGVINFCALTGSVRLVAMPPTSLPRPFPDLVPLLKLTREAE